MGSGPSQRPHCRPRPDRPASPSGGPRDTRHCLRDPARAPARPPLPSCRHSGTPQCCPSSSSAIFPAPRAPRKHRQTTRHAARSVCGRSPPRGVAGGAGGGAGRRGGAQRGRVAVVVALPVPGWPGAAATLVGSGKPALASPGRFQRRFSVPVRPEIPAVLGMLMHQALLWWGRGIFFVSYFCH